RKLIDIRAGDKRLLARSGEDHNANRRVVLSLFKTCSEFSNGRRIKRVSHGRTVDSDDRDRFPLFIQKIFEHTTLSTMVWDSPGPYDRRNPDRSCVRCVRPEPYVSTTVAARNVSHGTLRT